MGRIVQHDTCLTMSDIMERTLASLPRLLSASLLGGGKGGQASGQGPSSPPRSLQTLLKAVENARSRSEEKDVVKKELAQIKQELEKPGATAAQWSEIFPRVVFCSVLGYDIRFSHIYAIKLAAKGKGQEKRVGYLAAMLLLDPTMELTILIMGTLQRDLHSSNIFDNLMALSASAELVSSEIIPHMLPPVVKLLRHRQAIVREKAVHCIQAYFRRAPSLLQHMLPELKGMLGDKDPGVLFAVVTLLASIVEQNREELASLGLALISILQQVRARKFPSSYDYHGIPMPWLQIKLLKILAQLGTANDQLATSLLPLLSQILADANSKELMSLAVVSECLEAIATLAKGNEGSALGGEKSHQQQRDGLVVHDAGGGALSLDAAARVGSGDDERTQENDGSKVGIPRSADFPENGRTRRQDILFKLQPLLMEASKCVARFLNSGVPNLLYLGIRSLTQLVSVAPELASHHQGAVVECLDDLDSVVRRQTLSLLHHMANPANVKVVCAKMLDQVKGKDSDPGLQADVAEMVCDIAGRLAPDPSWYLNTLFPLLSLRMDSRRLSSLSKMMLTFFTKATQDPAWPAFSEELFDTMTSVVQNSDGESTPQLQFALKVLRFVPLPVKKTVLKDKFLAAGDRLLDCEESDVKEEVVLCVQELLLTGCLPRQDVIYWARASLGRCEHFTPRQLRQKLTELLTLASLEGEKSPLSTQNSAEVMDFSLSFLDAYTAGMCHKGKPFLKTQQYVAVMHQPVEQAVKPSSLITPTSPDSSSTPLSNDGGSLYKDSSLFESSPVGESFSLQSPTTPQQGLPVARKVWTKEGFQGDADAQFTFSSPGEGMDTNSRSVANKGEEKANPDRLDEREELAKALFQGLSPSTSFSLSQASTSAVVAVTSDSNPLTTVTGVPSASSVSMSTSAEDKHLASTADALAHASSSESQLQVSSQSIHDNTAMNESSLAELSRSDSGGWRALHASHTGSSQTIDTSDTDRQSTTTQSSATMTSEHVASDLGSNSNLSLSDDSLENIRDLSYQNSPAKKPLPDSSGATETSVEGTSDSRFQSSTYYEHLYERMENQNKSQTPAESDADRALYDGLGEDEGGENLYSDLQENARSLYSGFEDLTLYASGWGEEEEEEEERTVEETGMQNEGDRNETQPSDVFGDPILSTVQTSPSNQ